MDSLANFATWAQSFLPWWRRQRIRGVLALASAVANWAAESNGRFGARTFDLAGDLGVPAVASLLRGLDLERLTGLGQATAAPCRSFVLKRLGGLSRLRRRWGRRAVEASFVFRSPHADAMPRSWRSR
ncbi:DUF6183 family protein [Streptomyces sp. NPDC093982]|uniref:DUF6183 family protein n=1 Tax=Streptomyces sp. NPDC093982 TaxID=3155077 RepID=UPI003423EFE3